MLPVVWLAEPLDHLSTVWHLVDVSPTVLLEDLKPNCTSPTWSYVQVYPIPDTHPSTVIISYRAVCSVMYRRFNETRPIVHHHRVRPGNLFSGAGPAKEDHPPRSMQSHLAHGWLSYCSEFPGSNWVFDVGH